jgi:hypothetical protein
MRKIEKEGGCVGDWGDVATVEDLFMKASYLAM